MNQNMINSFSGLKLRICSSALRLMEQESKRRSHVETGGVVAGVGCALREEVIITHASQPGPRAYHARYAFKRDNLFCQNFLNNLARTSNGEIDYLGEWHKHFESNPRPSNRDVQTLTKIANDPNYHVSNPFLLIIGIDNAKKSLRVFINDGLSKLTLIEWFECNDDEVIKSEV